MATKFDAAKAGVPRLGEGAWSFGIPSSADDDEAPDDFDDGVDDEREEDGLGGDGDGAGP